MKGNSDARLDVVWREGSLDSYLELGKCSALTQVYYYYRFEQVWSPVSVSETGITRDLITLSNKSTVSNTNIPCLVWVSAEQLSHSSSIKQQGKSS